MTLHEDSDDEEMEKSTLEIQTPSDGLDQEEQRDTDGKLTFRDKYKIFHLISESQTSFQLLNVTLL